jgi:hypothetical protein
LATANLIKNPNFTNFRPLPGIGAGVLAESWNFAHDPGKRRPECRQAAEDFEGAQQFFSTKDLMDGWLFQRVYVGREAIGQRFVFGAKLALKSVDEGSGIGEYYASVGIDRVGEADPARKTAQWFTPQHQMYVPKWTELELVAGIENEWVTVYIQAANKWKVDGSLFVKSAYGYILDSEAPPVPDPPVPPVEPGEPGDLTPVIAMLSEALVIARANGDRIDAIAETLSKPWSITK